MLGGVQSLQSDPTRMFFFARPVQSRASASKMMARLAHFSGANKSSDSALWMAFREGVAKLGALDGGVDVQSTR